MQIGELAQAAGVRASRIRFYERRGLLAPAARSDNGYRRYDGRDLKIIAFIARAQTLGFTLKEIGAFLTASREYRAAQALAPRLEAKLAEIDDHIREARRRRRDLAALIQDLRRGAEAP